MDDRDVERVLVLAAHPDDIDFGAAGTVATWTDAGIDVSYCLVTDGDAGGFDPAVPRSEIGGIRRTEQAAAAACVGVRELHWLGYPDGRLTVSLELRRDISRVIRRVRPQRMVIPSPERDWTRLAPSHPDHLEAGEAAMRAIYPDARNPFAHPELLDEEGLAAWTVAETWLSPTPGADHPVDVTETFDRKMAALLSHKSQTAHLTSLREDIGAALVANGARLGLAEGRMAETFRVIDTR
ncbi:PIG-L deacetylase family protein [Streptomyces sp. SID3343]|uniref:PIG-L deacetylase family protein n=1 Tax=Streptomyces sp. SID3343 TaxID=2690260 RepID=UPI00136A53C5|nr:PIG-L deacetylase family protein [Streptomyces sp. SID3343]MYV97180.1 PIG-L family deacetylase [Streptomyces sp. SID3343]